MSKHELHTRGAVFKWSDDDKDWSEERKLLDIYERLGNMWAHSMYEGEDPYRAWNSKVGAAQNSIIDLILEMREENKNV